MPLLELDDGRCLADSDAILWFLTTGTDLQPSDDWGKAQALQWMFFEQYSHEPYIAVARFWLSYAPKEALEQKRAPHSGLAHARQCRALRHGDPFDAQ